MVITKSQKTLNGGGAVGGGIEIPQKPEKKAVAKAGSKKLTAAQRAKIRAQMLANIKAVQAAIPSLQEAGKEAAELVLGEIENSSASRGDYQKDLREIESVLKRPDSQAAWMAFYKATFGQHQIITDDTDKALNLHVENCDPLEDFHKLLQWMASKGWLDDLGEAPVGEKPKRELYHANHNYGWPERAWFSEKQEREALQIFQEGRDKVWDYWGEDQVRISKEIVAGQTVSLDEFLACKPGDTPLYIKGAYETITFGKGKESQSRTSYREGGMVLARNDGINYCIVKVANELRREYGVRAWNKFGFWMKKHKVIEKFTLPLRTLLKPNKEFLKDRGMPATMCRYFLLGIENTRKILAIREKATKARKVKPATKPTEPLAEKPTKAPKAKKVAKPRKPKAKKATKDTTVVQPASAAAGS